MPIPEDERFIHDDLVRYTEGGIEKIYEMWKKDKKVPPFFLSWPANPVAAFDGTKLDGVCTLELPENKSKWSSLMKKAVQLTDAYAILLCEQRQEDVRVILESGHGTKSWTMPIQRRADVLFLGKPTTKVDTESIGLLWSPSMARS